MVMSSDRTLADHDFFVVDTRLKKVVYPVLK